MKLIILEGGDRLGKSTLIKGLCEHYNYDNVIIRHFGKPPKGMSPQETLTFQFKCFTNEARLVHDIKRAFAYTKYNYYEDIVIWNRAHLGEYVYSQMFRNGNPKELKEKLLFFEHFHFGIHEHEKLQVYLILLTADPIFFLQKEDGNSFSKTLVEKTKELELFDKAFEFSLIENKLRYKVNNENGEFRSKQEILDDVLNFIK
jgi:thymidylate kinase